MRCDRQNLITYSICNDEFKWEKHNTTIHGLTERAKEMKTWWKEAKRRPTNKCNEFQRHIGNGISSFHVGNTFVGCGRQNLSQNT